MRLSLNSLIGYRMEAINSELGKVDEFYFDDNTWTIRYLIVKLEDWLSSRKVLISPSALITSSWNTGLFHVNLSREQIDKSPNIDTDKPVYRQQEMELYAHYAWQGYWDGTLADQHLRSSQQVTGYHIHGTDGEIGHIKDFIIDDQTWMITHVVADISNRNTKKHVLIPVANIKQMLWSESEIYVTLPEASIEKCELFDPANVGFMQGQG